MSADSSAIPLKSWLVLISVGILIFLLNIDYTAVNLTLVPISEEIQTDLNNLQWLLSAYVLIWAAFVIPAGKVADIYGKHNTLIVGLILFMVGSALTGLGHNLEILIAGRVLQGIGAAIFSAPAWAIIFTTASPEKQGLVMGVVLSFAGFGLAAGPTLAGFIIETLSWRWIYYVNIPLGILVIAILKTYGTTEILPAVKEKIDYVGGLLLGSGLCVTMYGINQIEVWGLGNSSLWMVIGLGLLLIIAHIIQDKFKKVRMIPLSILKNKGFMAACIGEFFMAINFSLVLVMMGLYLQNTLNYSSYETGLIFISMTISMGLLSPIGGKVIDTFGLKAPMLFGSIVAGIALGMMVFLTTSTSLTYIIISMFLVGTGLGAYFTACNLAMMRALPEKSLNLGSGVYMMFMMVGNTLSVVLSTSFVVLFGRNYLFEVSERHGVSLTPEQHQKLADVIAKVEHTPEQLAGFSSEQIPQFLSWIDEAFIHGLSINMMLGCIFAIIATGLTLWGIGAVPNNSGNSKKHAPIAI